MDKCASCGADMLWAITAYGNRNPINPQPHPKGNIILEERPDREEPNAIYIGKPDEGALFDEYEGRRYKSHFATCSQGPKWRKK